MYWNILTPRFHHPAEMLNSNIRCIEIYEGECTADKENCWIVTLDVLKFAEGGAMIAEAGVE